MGKEKFSIVVGIKLCEGFKFDNGHLIFPTNTPYIPGSFGNVAFAVNSCSSVRSSVWWEQGGGTVVGVVRGEDSVN